MNSKITVSYATAMRIKELGIASKFQCAVDIYEYFEKSVRNYTNGLIASYTISTCTAEKFVKYVLNHMKLDYCINDGILRIKTSASNDIMDCMGDATSYDMSNVLDKKVIETAPDVDSELSNFTNWLNQLEYDTEYFEHYLAGYNKCKDDMMEFIKWYNINKTPNKTDEELYNTWNQIKNKI